MNYTYIVYRTVNLFHYCNTYFVIYLKFSVRECSQRNSSCVAFQSCKCQTECSGHLITFVRSLFCLISEYI